MSKTIWWLIVIFGIGVIAFIFYHAAQKTQPQPQQPLATAPQAPAAPPQPQTHYPIPQASPEKPLPALNESDPAMAGALGSLPFDKTLVELFQLKDFIRHIVATIDNLPRRKLALRLMPVQPAAGKFLAAGKDANLTVSPDNAARYARYVRFAEAIDTGKLVALYVHFYPLFQQAYQELGYPQGYFNDRLIEVIDHLLAAPEAPASVKLVRPKIFYQFADPGLEARSAGQKILMRIGSENAARIKAKLRDIRAELTREGPKP